MSLTYNPDESVFISDSEESIQLAESGKEKPVKRQYTGLLAYRSQLRLGDICTGYLPIVHGRSDDFVELEGGREVENIVEHNGNWYICLQGVLALEESPDIYYGYEIQPKKLDTKDFSIIRMFLCCTNKNN